MRSKRKQRVIAQKQESVCRGKRVITAVPKRSATVRKVLKEHSAQRICVIRSVGGLGDVLMATPALRELKHRYPDAHLTFAIDRHRTFDDSYYELVKNALFIDEIVDARYVIRAKYDKVVDISSVCLPYERADLPPINRIDLFAKKLGFNKLHDSLPFYEVSPEEVFWARKIIGAGLQPVVCIHTASHDAQRSLPFDKHHEIVRMLNERVSGVRIVLFDFNNRNKKLATAEGVIDCSKCSTREKAALIQQCDVFFGPDSGPMHLAGALKIPSVVAFGSIPPVARLNHYPTHEAIVSGLSCAPCWYQHCPRSFKCMKEISPREIVNRIVSKIPSYRNKIVFHSILNPCDGYGGSAEQMALAMSDIDSRIRYTAYTKSNDWKALSEKPTQKLYERSGDALAYLGYFPPAEAEKPSRMALRARMRFFYTTFESTRPPKDWAGFINQFDKLFVSCDMCRDGFHDIGVEVPISIVPLGVKESLWPVVKRTGSGPFRFLLFANANMNDRRKNYMAAFTAFKKAFGNSKHVELMVKISGGDVPRFISREKNVRVVSGRFSQERLYQMVSHADCLLSPTRGEGYGLCQREMMATGMPVVAANFGGLKSIMEQSFNYSVPYQMSKASYGNLYVSRNGMSRDFGLWAEPDVDAMTDIIADLPGRVQEVRSKGLAGAQWIRENETYDICATRLFKEMGF